MNFDDYFLHTNLVNKLLDNRIENIQVTNKSYSIDGCSYDVIYTHSGGQIERHIIDKKCHPSDFSRILCIFDKKNNVVVKKYNNYGNCVYERHTNIVFLFECFP